MPSTASVPDAAAPVGGPGLPPSILGPGDAGPAKRGRKRHHDSRVERRMILDAAMVVMRRNGFAEAKITDILAEAALSNRAFYRHFSSKDELLLGMCARDMAFVARQLRTKINDAPDPVAALHAYIDAYLNTFYEPQNAERIAVLGSDGARRAEGYDEEVRRLNRLVVEPLLEVIRDGAEAGVFRTSTPDLDGTMICLLLSGLTEIPASVRLPRGEITAHVMRFCGPALGLAEDQRAEPATRR